MSVVTVILLTTSATSAFASAPLKAVKIVPPYTAASSYVNVTTTNTGCGGTYTQVRTPSFNLSRDHARFGEYVNVTSGCRTASTATYFAKLGITNLTLTIPRTGNYFIQANWGDSVWYNFTYNYYPASPTAVTSVIFGDTIILTDVTAGTAWNDSTIVNGDNTSYGCYHCYLAGYRGHPEIGKIHLTTTDRYVLTTFAWIEIRVTLPANSGRAYVQSAEVLSFWVPIHPEPQGTALRSISLT